MQDLPAYGIENQQGVNIRRSIVMVLTIATALGAAGCDRTGADAKAAKAADQAAPGESDYIHPPQILTASADAGGGVTLSGRADSLVRVRLSSPDGEAYGSTALGDGAWSVPIPPTHGIREFGLSEVIGARAVQGEGYVAVIPGGRPAAVLLRAGSGAVALVPPQAPLKLETVDFDTGGGATVSGTAKPGVVVHVILDGAGAGEARADAAGRYAVTLTMLLRPGAHQIVVETANAVDQAGVAVSAPPPISGLPFHGERQAGSWRIDWVTPGGGVQSTIILDQPEHRP
jgi:hypothetical protein